MSFEDAAINRGRILKYLKDRPGSTMPDIAFDLRLTTAQTSQYLGRMESKKEVTHRGKTRSQQTGRMCTKYFATKNGTLAAEDMIKKVATNLPRLLPKPRIFGGL